MTRRRLRALSGLALAAVSASCALSFPDYELEGEATSSSSGTGGIGGAGGSAPLAPVGEPCSVDEDCLEGNCLERNGETGRVCCSTACMDMGEMSCGTNGKCDPGGDGCASYPAGTTCGDPTCEAGTGVRTVQECKAGACTSSETLCPQGLYCEEDGSDCKSECVTDEDCVEPLAQCPAGLCIQPDGAPCESDEACDSGFCGTKDLGNCCAAMCPTDGPCGATDCNEQGGCVFPGAETVCGDGPMCNDAKITSEVCDQTGDCGTESVTQPCPGHLRCESPLGCHSTCGSSDATGDGRCVSGYWCDGATCQPASLDEGTPCTRNAQCRTESCNPMTGKCTGVDCDLDDDGEARDDAECGGADCDDDDARVFPGQMDFFDTPRTGGGFDFNCDGEEEALRKTYCTCPGEVLLGVASGDAGCGQTGELHGCGFFFFVCAAGGVIDANTTQSCR